MYLIVFPLILLGILFAVLKVYCGSVFGCVLILIAPDDCVVVLKGATFLATD